MSKEALPPPPTNDTGCCLNELVSAHCRGARAEVHTAFVALCNSRAPPGRVSPWLVSVHLCVCVLCGSPSAMERARPGCASRRIGTELRAVQGRSVRLSSGNRSAKTQRTAPLAHSHVLLGGSGGDPTSLSCSGALTVAKGRRAGKREEESKRAPPRGVRGRPRRVVDAAAGPRLRRGGCRRAGRAACSVSQRLATGCKPSLAASPSCALLCDLCLQVCGGRARQASENPTGNSGPGLRASDFRRALWEVETSHDRGLRFSF